MSEGDGIDVTIRPSFTLWAWDRPLTGLTVVKISVLEETYVSGYTMAVR